MRPALLLLIPLAFVAAFGLSRVLRPGTGGRAKPSGAPAPALATQLPDPGRPGIAEGDSPGQPLEASARRADPGAGPDREADAREEAARAALAQGDAGPAEALLRSDLAGSRRAARIALATAFADGRRAQGDLPGAAKALVRQLESMAGAKAAYAELRPVADALDAVDRELVFNPTGNWRSETVVVEKGDSWHRLAKRFAAAKGIQHGIGLLRAVNRKAGDLLVPGETLRVPLDPVRIAVYRESFAAFAYLGDLVVRVYPIGIGREGAETPAGKFTIGQKVANPPWWKPKPPIPAGDPRNPLGARWLGFRADGRDIPYGIHGTEREGAVGGRISEGCIRLHNRDVVELYDLVPDAGTPVEVF